MITLYHPDEIMKQSAPEVTQPEEAAPKQRTVPISKLNEAEKILETEEEKLDSTLRRTRYGRSLGPVVRQTAKLVKMI